MAKKNDITPTKRVVDSKARDEALEAAINQIKQQHGEGSIMRLGENSHLDIEAISTGSPSLDIATGIGGIPKGRIIEVYGPESSGKTTLTLHMIAEAQKAGGRAAFIDAEHALDPDYAANLGVDIDNLLVSQPDTGDQALAICEMLVRSGALDIVVIDSVAALVPKTELQGEMGDSFVGLQARLMSQALRKLTGSVNKSRTAVVFINQLREKVSTGYGYGPAETTTGGRALKFYSSMRFDVRKIETLKQGDKMIGSKTRVKIVKNKVAPPFRQAEFDIMYGQGISVEGDVLDRAVEYKIVKKSGAWYSFGDQRIGQGRENVKDFLKENPDDFKKIRDALDAAIEAERRKQAGEDQEDGQKDQKKPSKADLDIDLTEVDEDGVIIE